MFNVAFGALTGGILAAVLLRLPVVFRRPFSTFSTLQNGLHVDVDSVHSFQRIIGAWCFYFSGGMSAKREDRETSSPGHKRGAQVTFLLGRLDRV